MAQGHTCEQRRRAGGAVRRGVPRSSHAIWTPPATRPDPITLLEEDNRPRLPDLVPVRYGRMLVSPFAFLRGSMANDLPGRPAPGCGFRPVATRTWATSACSASQSGTWSSTSTTSLKRSLVPPGEAGAARLAARLCPEGAGRLAH